MHPLRRWMLLASRSEQNALAAAARTSRNYLYQLADGRRRISVDMAVRLELAAVAIARESKGRLPKLKRQDLSPVCGACPHAPACKNQGKDTL